MALIMSSWLNPAGATGMGERQHLGHGCRLCSWQQMEQRTQVAHRKWGATMTWQVHASLCQNELKLQGPHRKWVSTIAFCDRLFSPQRCRSHLTTSQTAKATAAARQTR